VQPAAVTTYNAIEEGKRSISEHLLWQIVEAAAVARSRGLRIPN
jgi:hypothetical protein